MSDRSTTTNPNNGEKKTRDGGHGKLGGGTKHVLCSFVPASLLVVVCITALFLVLRFRSDLPKAPLILGVFSAVGSIIGFMVGWLGPDRFKMAMKLLEYAGLLLALFAAIVPMYFPAPSPEVTLSCYMQEVNMMRCVPTAKVPHGMVTVATVNIPEGGM